MLTATEQWFTLPVLISCYCFVCTQANSGSVYLHTCKLDAIAATTTFALGCKLSANLFFRPVFVISFLKQRWSVFTTR